MSADAGAHRDSRLNEIGVLRRREIEARIVAPLLDALGAEFGRERVLEIARETIVRVAQEQGRELAAAMGDGSLSAFGGATKYWELDGALEIETLASDGERLDFNVRRCRYAEMYRALGIPELGAALSCNRDFALIQGFNPDVQLTRTQTIMQGASHCDFRYRLQPRAAAPDAE
jgi:hypothetical protein